MGGSKGKRCGCINPATGKQWGRSCPDLRKRHHGLHFYVTRIDTSTGRRKLERSGYATAAEAQAKLDLVNDLVKLAGDDSTRARIGDLIFASTKHGGELPSVEDVRRRLALGADPGGSGETFGQAWDDWLAGKKRLRPSSLRRLTQIGEHWLKPVLADVLIERINAGHCASVFDRVDAFNEELEAAADDERAPDLPGDVRKRAQVVGVATQHRIYAALREFLNYLWKKRHVIQFNPIYAVELEPEETPEAQRWTAVEVYRFLAATAADPLGLLFRLVILRGMRRGEAVGLRWAGFNSDEGYVTIWRPILQIGGEVIEGKAKNKGSERRVYLDAATVKLLRAHRKAQAAARLRASTAWKDNDLIFCREDGSPWPPDVVSRRFKALAAEAGLPVIKLHEGRHSAASLARDARVDDRSRQEQLGHTTKEMADRYTHLLADALRADAEKVARHVEEAGA